MSKHVYMRDYGVHWGDLNGELGELPFEHVALDVFRHC